MTISRQEFDLIRDYVHEHSGILIADGKEYLIENRLNVLLVQSGCQDYTQFHEKLRTDPGTLGAKVIDAMTTNETLWFRDASFFSAMGDFVVPELLKKGTQQPQVRIWSAACSTGQEPYSIAMLLDHGRRKMGDDAPPLERFQILATDISPTALMIAKTGRYSQLAISRGMRQAFLERYFIPQANNLAHEVNPAIRQIVTFQSFNLKEAFTGHGLFDLILCRNVLIYFSNELKSAIYQKLHGALAPDGLLAIGASESPRGYTSLFDQVTLGSATLYRPKKTTSTAPVGNPAPTPTGNPALPPRRMQTKQGT
ncbi:MAG: protein-glutamate O-methyltransferase CheR [Magnetococcales bacterium]|nr:protein-glutamate O-methyltransferase CheR [Magnetococcales bacterium]